MDAPSRAAASGRRALVMALALAAAADLSAQDAALERFQAWLRATQSARGEFEQKVYDRAGRLVQEARGRFAFLRPGRFLWVYAQPVPQTIVGDGTRVWIHDEDLNQVTVRRLEKAIGATPAALLAGAADLERAFALAEAGEREGLLWLEAIPREREAGFERVRLGLGSAGLEAMELSDHFGQRTVLRFRGVMRNSGVDAALFRFRPPPGADVLGDP